MNPIDELKERRRTFVRIGRGDVHGEYGPEVKPAPRVIRAQEIPATERQPRPWIQWPTRPNAERLTASADVGVPSGLGTGWTCRHGLDQTGSKRCIRCMASHELSYVWRKPAGGSPGCWRWLCEPCMAVYSAIGLVGGIGGLIEPVEPRRAGAGGGPPVESTQ